MLRTYRGIHPQIAPYCFIEASAQIIGEVTIGERSSVWFNSIAVMMAGMNIPPRSLVAGVPAVIKRQLDDKDSTGDRRPIENMNLSDRASTSFPSSSQ